ncbi:dephospho-CoA kinase [Helicobacter equorum]|uniref:dephospho-CoA kinase n=1 Tax=Helicobacter equorum TaxID=361872 RepID=UPI000CF138C5|nr:dephospho-CoA kinase [Helicobacter equorum]
MSGSLSHGGNLDSHMNLTLLQYGVALTGCIGSGKSSVSAILRGKGYVVLCADEIAHTILQASVNEVALTFGSEFVREGIVDRKALGTLVFGDKNARKKLESLLHPKIHQAILYATRELESQQKCYFLDIPLFFESGGREKYPVCKILLVYAPKDQCLERIIARDSLSRESAQARIDAQMDIEQKCAMSDYVIKNVDNKMALKALVEEALEKLEDSMQTGK